MLIVMNALHRGQRIDCVKIRHRARGYGVSAVLEAQGRVESVLHGRCRSNFANDKPNDLDQEELGPAHVNPVCSPSSSFTMHYTYKYKERTGFATMI